MKKTKSKARKISIKVNEEKLKSKIVMKYFKFFCSMQKQYGTDLYFEYIGFRLLVDHLKVNLGLKELKKLFKESIS